MIVQWIRGELTINNFTKELALYGVESNLTATYTAKQDGVVELSNKIIVNDSKSIIKLANYPKSFWVSAIETAI